MRFTLIIGTLFLYFFSFSQTFCPILPSPVTYVTSDVKPLSFSKFKFETQNIPQEIQKILPELIKLYFVDGDTHLEFLDTNSNISFQTLSGAYPESYSINVNSNGVRIAYTSASSCFHALHSLFQLCSYNNTANVFSSPICFVKDYPNFKWRGLHLDVSRHFFTVDEVKKYIDLMSMYKFNMFHWHLTDDQGWRIEIKQYPKLTEVGAWRDSTVENHYSTYPRTWNTEHYGGYYTQEQIKEVVAYASARQITIVPEIEMPGHARAALAAYPELSCTGQKQSVPGLWGVFDDVFCTKDSTLMFLQNILDEVINLFPGPFIHVGGDEVPKTRWNKCPACQTKMHILGLKDEHELQSYFIGQMDQYLKKHNRKLIGWDEILEGGLSSGAAVMSWRGTEGGITAAKQNHFVVMTPGSHCYFDHYQGKSASEPLAIGGYTPLEKVYEFNPIPSELNAQEAHYILGGQANLWTEYIPAFDQLTYMTYPRAIALSQALWCAQKPPYSTFETCLKNFHIPRITGPLHNTHVSLSFMKPAMKFKRISNGISLEFELKDTTESVIASTGLKEEGIRFTHGMKLIFNRPKKKIKNESYAFFSSCCKDSLTVMAHRGLGSKVTYITAPNDRYNSGDLTLVDGQFGARPWRGYQWIGFDTSIIEIAVDLGKKTKIKTLTLGFLYEPSSWIQLPKEVTVKFENGKQKTVTVSSEKPKIFLKGKSQHITFIIKGPTQIPKGFPGEGNQPWFFVDEVLIE